MTRTPRSAFVCRFDATTARLVDADAAFAAYAACDPQKPNSTAKPTCPRFASTRTSASLEGDRLDERLRWALLDALALVRPRW